MSTAPLGVFDSGVGGLSVAREIRRRLPAEEILYFADTAYCPYGGRPLEEIRARSVAVVEELIRRGAKMVVVACNTASGAALETLRELFPIPIVGLEPAVKPATQRTRNGRVGVLATEGTLRSARFQRLVEKYGAGAEVVARACPELVDLVEGGEILGDEVEGYLSRTLAPVREAGVDTLVLGCTHYPFLREAIGRVMGSGVEILDSGEAVARQVERVLQERGELSAAGSGRITLLTTGDPVAVGRIVSRLWEGDLEIQPVGQLRSSGALSAEESSR